jgi:hypothetical protein
MESGPSRTETHDLINLIHHHISISLPALNSAQLAFFSFPVNPGEVRLHFWTQRAGFPTTALRFCTHMASERTVLYDGSPAYSRHNPEHVDAAQPSTRACGDPPISFIMKLNRVVWDQLQEPVIGLTALRKTLMPKIEEILQESEGSTEVEGTDQDVALEGWDGADVREEDKAKTEGNDEQVC